MCCCSYILVSYYTTGAFQQMWFGGLRKRTIAGFWQQVVRWLEDQQSGTTIMSIKIIIKSRSGGTDDTQRVSGEFCCSSQLCTCFSSDTVTSEEDGAADKTRVWTDARVGPLAS